MHHLQVMGILNKVSSKEKLSPIPEELALRLAQASERNLRRALLMMDACHVQQGSSQWSADLEVRDGLMREGVYFV